VQAQEVMTRAVVAVAPDTPLEAVARTLLEHGVSAVPVVDDKGAVLGMVSEGDLIGRSDAERVARRDWWLTLLAEGEALHPDFLATLRLPRRTARDVMAAPVVTVGETAEARDIAALLALHRIKRVPVMHDGKIVGIVSRADLLRAFAAEAEAAPAPAEGGTMARLLGAAVARLDHHNHHGAVAAPAPGAKPAPDTGFTAADFATLDARFVQHESDRRAADRRAATDQRRATVAALIDHHIAAGEWRALLQKARAAAENGAKDFLLLRFPSDLCSDGGRAINAPLPDWPHTLRGEAAEIYLGWERDLKPRGFHLTARVMDFPGGKPGDIGLFLGWTE